LSSADKSSDADVRSFWRKNFGFFEIYGVSARTEGGRGAVRTFCRQEVNFSRFCADIFHGSPLLFKPGKPTNSLASFRPISLISISAWTIRGLGDNHMSDPSVNLPRHFGPPLGKRAVTATPRWGAEKLVQILLATPAVINCRIQLTSFWIVSHRSSSARHC